MPELDPALLENATVEELLEIEKLLDAQEILESPAKFAEHLSGGEWKPYRHLLFLNDKLLETINTPGKRLIVTMPPRHGKSELCSRWFPAWFLNRFPEKRIMLCSYEADFAAEWGRKTRDVIESNEPRLAVRVSAKSSAANRWGLEGHDGGMVTAGVGGPITGRGADVLLIDDPVKNQEEAMSATYRDRAWGWWRSTAFTRLEPSASVIVIQTRWHEDDLAGRMIAEEPDKWEVVNLPALAEDNDPLGRAQGEALCPERYDEKALEEIRVTTGPDTWSALYQQRPQPEGGGRFKKATFRYWKPRTTGTDEEDRFYELMDPDGITLVRQKDCWRFVTVDTATSLRKRADYTCASVWDVAPWVDPSRLILVHRYRERIESPDHLKMLRDLYDTYKPVYIGVEKATFGLALIQAAMRDGLPIRELRPDKDKWMRSEQAAVLCENGRAYFPRGASWLHEWESELLTFPAGKHDDQVDTFSYAAHEVMRGTNMKGPRPAEEKSKMDRHFDEKAKPSRKRAIHPTIGAF